MARNNDPDTAAVLAVTRRTPGRGRGRKSDLYRWMAARHDALAEGFAKEPPSWTALAKFFTERGMLSTDGLPQTAASVRATWVRVTQAAARRQPLRQGAHPVVAADSPPDPQPPETGSDNDRPGTEPPPVNMTFTPIRGKS